MNLKVWIAILLVFGLLCAVCDGRGSRSSSRSSRSGSSSYRSYRSGSSSSTHVRYYRGPTYSSGSWKTAAAIGTVYGLMSYRHRSLYLRYPDREPTICYNEVNLKNSTYGYFICPEANMSDNFDKCCGDSDEQSCCTLAAHQEERKQANIIGIVVGVVLGCIAIAVIIYCCIVRRRRRATQGQVIQKQQTATFHTAQPPPRDPNFHHSGQDPGTIPLNSYTDNPQPPMGGGGFIPTPSGGFQDGSGMAQGPNYGYAAGSFQSSYPSPYPAGNQSVGFEDMGKAALPEGEVSGPAPSQPYPPPHGGSYPPPGGSYPLTGAGYPPPGQQGVNHPYPNAPPPPYSG